MATQPTVASLIERLFQDYADAAEIKKILVDASETITQQNQLVTLKYLADNYMLKGAVTTPDLTGLEVIVHKGAANGYAGLDANAKVPSTQLLVVDNLGSHDASGLLSANQGRILNEDLQTKVSATRLQDYELLAHKAAASGYAPLDANSKVPVIHLPASIATPHHIFTSQADMLSGGANIVAGELVLVLGDPSPDKNGEYVALQDAPAAINHYDHLGYHVRAHRHEGADVDVTLNGSNQRLDIAIASLDSATDAVKVTADKAKTDIAAHLANSSSAHTVGAISGLSGPLAQVVTNTGKINTNTTEVALAKASAAKAESDLHKHLVDTTNAHDYKSIGNIDKVFEDRLAGFNPTGHHDVFIGNMDTLRKDSVYLVSKNTHGTFPHGINSTYHAGLLITYSYDGKQGLQIMYERVGATVGMMWTRGLSNKTDVTAWRGHNVLSGTAAPSGGDDGDLYVQHS